MPRSDANQMTVRALIARAIEQEWLNFVLTNRIPRRLATRFVGWFSRIENPLVRSISIAVWRLFCDVDLTDAHKQRFSSLHDCFVRELREGARPAHPDPGIIASPCDAIVGAYGRIEDDRLYQIKGFSYRLAELLGEERLAADYRDGVYATLRLTAGMYHHFHAPHDLIVESVRYFPGDVWNVNPAALRRIERLYCRNERAVLRCRLTGSGLPLTLVPVAAILVAGIRLPFLGQDSLREGGARTIRCAARLPKGERMGWFEHGSTILVLGPSAFALAESVREGAKLRAGEPLLRLTGAARSA